VRESDSHELVREIDNFAESCHFSDSKVRVLPSRARRLSVSSERYITVESVIDSMSISPTGEEKGSVIRRI